MEYLDTDLTIQEKKGMNIKDIFKKKGEAYFRAEELRLLQKIKPKSNMVIATGGGIILQKVCMDIL